MRPTTATRPSNTPSDASSWEGGHLRMSRTLLEPPPGVIRYYARLFRSAVLAKMRENVELSQVCRDLQQQHGHQEPHLMHRPDRVDTWECPGHCWSPRRALSDTTPDCIVYSNNCWIIFRETHILSHLLVELYFVKHIFYLTFWLISISWNPYFISPFGWFLFRETDILFHILVDFYFDQSIFYLTFWLISTSWNRYFISHFGWFLFQIIVEFEFVKRRPYFKF